MHSKEEIIEAIEILREECYKVDDCIDCQYDEYGECMLRVPFLMELEKIR